MTLPNEALARLRALVDEQAEDDGLWFVARTAPELYEALRKAISNLEMAEVNSYAFEGDDDPEYIGAKEALQRDIEFFRAVLLTASNPKEKPDV